MVYYRVSSIVLDVYDVCLPPEPGEDVLWSQATAL